MSFGARIKERRESLGLKQSELGAILGIQGSAISNYELGVSSPKADVLYKLFDALQCDANYLFQDEMTNLHKQKGPALSSEAMKLARDYDSMDDFGKYTVRFVADSVLEKAKQERIEKNTEIG